MGQTVDASNGGQLYITSDGAMGFYQSGDFDDLNDGETRQTTATYQITDGTVFSNTATVTITVAGTGLANTPPNAVATADFTSGIAPLTVNFIGSGSTDDGSIISYNWEFADVGGPSSVTNPVHTFNFPGTYNVVLTVMDDGSPALTDTATITITVSAANQAPTAIIAATPTSGTAPLTVNFDNQGSFDNDGNIVLTNWDFGDGSPGNTGGFPTAVSHTFNTPGTYNVVLTVTDNGSPALSDTATVTINISSIPVSDVNIMQTSLNIVQGNSGVLTATVIPANATNTNIIWSSNNTAVATVDSNGNVTGVGIGTATITAASEENPLITDTLNITVTPNTTFNRITGLYTAPSGSTVLVEITTEAFESITVNLKVHTQSDQTGTELLSLGYVALVPNGDSVLRSDFGQFIMPLNGQVYFYARQVGDGISDLTITNNIGPVQSSFFGPANPVQ